MIRELGETIGDAVVESVGRAVGRSQEQRPLPADLLESDEAFLAVFDAPGAEPADVQVRFEANTVVTRVDRFRRFHDGFEMRFPGRGLSLDGSISLPQDAVVAPEDATATLKDNGTLHVRIPKVEPEVDEEMASKVSTMDEEGVKPEELETDEEGDTANGTDTGAETPTGDEEPTNVVEKVSDEDRDEDTNQGSLDVGGE